MNSSLRAVITLLVPAALIIEGASPARPAGMEEVVFPTPGAGKVVFSHKKHLQRKSGARSAFSCQNCHNNASGKSGHRMAELERGEACGACHNGARAFAVVRCTRCHHVREIAFQVKAAGPVHFSHKAHVQKMRCDACHNTIFNAGANGPVTMAAMGKGERCGACHDGTRAFSLGECARCHLARDRQYAVEGAGMVTFRHGVHLQLYVCTECHPGLYRRDQKNTAATMAEMEQHRACGACHDGNTAFTVTRNCATCHKV